MKKVFSCIAIITFMLSSSLVLAAAPDCHALWHQVHKGSATLSKCFKKHTKGCHTDTECHKSTCDAAKNQCKELISSLEKDFDKAWSECVECSTK